MTGVRKGASADTPRLSYSAEEWTSIRDRAVMLGQAAQVLTVTEIEAWIEQGDRSISFGPIFHPTEFMRGNDELQKQLVYMRAVLTFLRAVDETMGARA